MAQVENEAKENKESLELTPVNILCFGSSLTRGYLDLGRKYIPYSITLQQLIQKDYSKSITLKIIEAGVDGEAVTDTMPDRLENILKNNKFDIVIVQGGGNDIGRNKKLEAIYNGFNKMFDIIIKTYKCQLIIVTIPPLRNPHKSIDENRNKLNEFVSKQDNVVHLFEYIQSLKDEDRKKFFDIDGLHFTANGYQQFGNLVYEKVKPLLNQMITK